MIEFKTTEQELKDLLLEKEVQFDSAMHIFQAELNTIKEKQQEELDLQKRDFQKDSQLSELKQKEQLKIKEEKIASMAKQLSDSSLKLSLAEEKIEICRREKLCLELQIKKMKDDSVKEILSTSNVWIRFINATNEHNIEVSTKVKDLLSLKFHHLLETAMVRYASEEKNYTVLCNLVKHMERLIMNCTINLNDVYLMRCQ